MNNLRIDITLEAPRKTNRSIPLRFSFKKINPIERHWDYLYERLKDDPYMITPIYEYDDDFYV
jgi:hypothetical protein